MEKPIRKGIVLFEDVIKACEDYIDYLDSDDCHEDRIGKYEYYVFETALTVTYGPDVWKWVDNKIV
jgi:hypothetical protein